MMIERPTTMTEMVSRSSNVAERARLARAIRGYLKFALGGRTEKRVEIEI